MAIQLAAFDLDGTLVRGETCVVAIARTIGRVEECARFEKLQMRDIAAVSAAREAMAVWYRTHSTTELCAALAHLPLAPGTEEAFKLLRARGVSTAIVSITWSFAVEWFARRLGADYWYGTLLTPNGIEHVWPADKGRWLRNLARRLELPRAAVAAVGDSDGDRELLQAAGLRFFVGEKAAAISDVEHVEEGNILEIAEKIVATGCQAGGR